MDCLHSCVLLGIDSMSGCIVVALDLLAVIGPWRRWNDVWNSLRSPYILGAVVGWHGLPPNGRQAS